MPRRGPGRLACERQDLTLFGNTRVTLVPLAQDGQFLDDIVFV